LNFYSKFPHPLLQFFDESQFQLCCLVDHPVTFTVTDQCGNSTTLVRTIVSEDSENPIITCPADIILDFDEHCNYDVNPTITGEPNIDDNCSGSFYDYVDD